LLKITIRKSTYFKTQVLFYCLVRALLINAYILAKQPFQAFSIITISMPNGWNLHRLI